MAFDLKHPTFRHEMYDGYKGTRHAMPDELAQQMPILKEPVSYTHLDVYKRQGSESFPKFASKVLGCFHISILSSQKIGRAHV